MRKSSWPTLFFAAALFAPNLAAQEQEIELTPLADLAVMNGLIWTGTDGPVPPDPACQPTSLAIRDGIIIAIGDGRAMLPHISPGTHIINAQKRRIIPGMTDSHTHIVSGGLQLNRLSLRNAENKQAFIDAIAAAARNTRPGEWILGGRYSVESWDQPASPTRHWIDSVTRDIPVFLSRMDGHQALANSAALKRAGITADGPPDPTGGEIERDPVTKEPTGILKESAMHLVSRLIPSPNEDQRFAALLQAMSYANSLGVTTVHDMSDPDDLAVFARADRESRLTLRITSYPQFGDWENALPRITESNQSASPMFRVAGMKQYMDGSLGSRTAYMREAFTDATSDMPYPRGQLTAWASSSDFQKQVTRLMYEDFQPAVHAIGDQANHLVLNAYELAKKLSSKNSLPLPRIEHVQHLLVDDIPRFAKIGVVASMQPYHKSDDGRYAERAIGRERLSGSYAFRQLVDSGALVIFGSDWPVVTIDPFPGIDAAVSARTLDGKTWLAAHSLNVAEALYAYTVAPAKAIGRDHELGTLEVGKRADVVVLFEDPFTVPADQLGRIHVAQTIVNGLIVHNAAP
jgi:predicted amidohydrolase YtcJ